MNIFKVLASGKNSLREEFVSAYFAYLLSPKMDHGLGFVLLKMIVKKIREVQNLPELSDLVDELQNDFRTDLFDESKNNNFNLELEYKYNKQGGIGYIDIVLSINKWYIIIENKINSSSCTDGQVYEQYLGFKETLEKKDIEEHNILILYLVPAISSEGVWSSGEFYENELDFKLGEGDYSSVVYWQPPEDDETISIVSIFREILNQSRSGEIDPITYDLNQSLKSFINFCLNDFNGYPYDKVVEKNVHEKMKVKNILKSNKEIYIGVQHGKAGLIRKAWENSDFTSEYLNVSDTKESWQYLSLKEFKTICNWAINPKDNNLSGIHWEGKPFFTDLLYLVSKDEKSNICIGMRGGLEKLRNMDIGEIKDRKGWEVSNERKTPQWFTGEEFCNVLEEKGYKIRAPEKNN
ncbi:PD-(D/E)XK nuclease family protein [Halanaerobacter jeridensis]|uniref:PD-(D/E)XK nuclease superfamily protein n=1 Tax=Halanaerobacter jeridensis TaxID=706427 RepID=A0A938XT23_9FIRM|nr:PD-(D/E)XK nuclease family protein [Halanaerobacter jeridensis]MBM7555791.1 hypothetical protein [Halanaerobacter jeridensis]